MSDWSQFLVWAKRFVAEVDLEAEERGYKLVMAARLHEATEAARANDANWISLLRQAVQGSNLLPWQFVDSLMKAAEREPSRTREAILALVDAQDRVGELDGFTEAVRAIHPAATPGNLAALGSVLLMSMEAPTYPPYRPEPVGEWAARVGADADTSSASQRYRTLLTLCDELLREAEAAQLPVRDRLDAQGLAWTVLKYDPPVRWNPLDQARLTAWRRGEDPTAASVDRGSGVAPKMEAGAWLVLGPGLRGETSAIDSSLRTWTVEHARELRKRIEVNPAGGDTFMDKLARQMVGADDAVIVLLAELLYLRNAPLSDMRQETKANRSATVLSWGSARRSLPQPLVDALDKADAFNGGQGYHAQTPAHLLWMTRFVEHWLEISESQRAEGLRDPFAFRDITASTAGDMPSIRYVVEYLAWPGIFPSVVSADHRAKIHAALMGDLGERSGSDDRAITQDLSALQAFHNRKAKGEGERYMWYRSPFRERWNPGKPPRAWLIRPGDGGSPLVIAWKTQGFVSLKAEMLGTVRAGASQSELRAVIRQGYNHLDRSQQEALTTDYHQFLTVMQPDDVVVTIDHDQIIVGIITDGPEYVEVPGSRLRRPVTWSSTVVERSALPDPVPSLLEQQGHVVDLMAAYGVLASYVSEPDGANGSEVDEPPNRPLVETVPRLAAVTEELAQSLFMDRTDLQEIVDLLQARQQVVLYGPPGTGKTYIAQKLAKHLVGSEDPSRVRLVQFHPSYSYEDFFEGYRPSLSESGQPTFELKNGPLRLLAGEATDPENRGNAYVLIIDEMNRTNLAKVFGELYFLLEYRKETVRLQYQPETPFRLPPNLFIIGTMNTADRSIALVDAAIRRRFPFYELHPNEEPVKGVLERYLHRHTQQDDRADLLKALNQAIGTEGRDLQIGPSYLMRPDVDRQGGIERVWKHDLMPLLEEHYYGHKSRETIHREFGLDAIRAKVGGLAPPAVVADESPDGGDEEIGLEETGAGAE
jgi:5-methylcytosine-specific restriction protein B